MSIQRVFVAGHKGMVGSALVRLLQKKNFEIVTKDRKELDLLNQNEVKSFFKNEKINQVYLAAAKVGGIHANSIYPAEFIYENIMIQTNIINSAFISGVKKLLFLGSSCIYPKDANQPIKEKELLSGLLESTNEPYAIAKIAGLKMCESFNRQYGESHNIDYRSVMPTNLYGPNDNYHKENSHVIPALIRKFYDAKILNKKKVIVWGTGTPRREFMHVDDFARACYHIMNLDIKIFYKKAESGLSYINVGVGSDLTIAELAEIVKQITEYSGIIEWDPSKPDGTKKKNLDSSRIFELGWMPEISLKEGLMEVYENFKIQYEKK
jgi:GDP-L-fucose synthase